jgi:hypothetical protein
MPRIEDVLGDPSTDSKAVSAIRRKIWEGHASVAEFAVGVGRSTASIERYIKAGMPHKRLGHTVMVHVDPAIEWLQKLPRKAAA